jgi:hypothetical protein
MGRGAGPVGDAGGETVILPRRNHAGWEKGGVERKTSEKSNCFVDVKESRSSGSNRDGLSRMWRVARISVQNQEPLKFFGGKKKALR